MIDTGSLVEEVLFRLRDGGKLIGDGVAPPEGGWSVGSPNVDQFVPYSVLGFNGATTTLPDLSTNPDWDVAFAIRHYGGSRKQADWQATRVRNVIEMSRGLTFSGSPFNYKVIGVYRWQLGTLDRNDQVDPPYWQTFDSFVLMCSRA